MLLREPGSYEQVNHAGNITIEISQNQIENADSQKQLAKKQNSTSHAAYCLITIYEVIHVHTFGSCLGLGKLCFSYSKSRRWQRWLPLMQLLWKVRHGCSVQPAYMPEYPIAQGGWHLSAMDELQILYWKGMPKVTIKIWSDPKHDSQWRMLETVMSRMASLWLQITVYDTLKMKISNSIRICTTIILASSSLYLPPLKQSLNIANDITLRSSSTLENKWQNFR